jgi:6-pyruvoyltetrahydropterin/6-carboxytetrahydropterin synthase
MIQQYYPQTPHNYTFELNKDMHISAAHYIPHPESGKCQNVHGHNYFINLTIAGDRLNDAGFLVDFKLLKDIIHKRYDHAFLNELPEFSGTSYPSTEVFAEQIWKSIQEHLDRLETKPKCIQVIVRETPTSYVVYRPKNGGETHG